MRQIRSITAFRRAALALVLVVIVARGAQGAALVSSRDFWRGEVWTRGFRLEPGVTYTYELSSGDKNRPFSRRESRGTLNLWVPPGETNEIRFWYTVDGVRRSGTAPNDPHGLAGALLLSALAGPEPLPEGALRLLVTPFLWVQWADMFFESDFKSGVVWEVYQHPPLRFTAERERPGVYSGEATSGREVLLVLRIDLAKPLPERVESRYGRDVYVAELAGQPSGRVLR